MNAALVTLALAGAAADTHAADALAKWHALWPGVKSLVVEFDAETVERGRGLTFRYAGRFRLVRTPAGPLADLAETHGGKLAFSGLLLGDRPYHLDPGRKAADLHRPPDGDTTAFLARCVHPLALLTDPARAGAFQVRPAGADGHYTYLTFTPTPATARDGVGARGASAAVLRHAAGDFPAGVPMKLRTADELGQVERTITVKSWKVNAPDGPTAADFVRPEDRPGWTVTDYGELWRKALAKPKRD